MGLDSSKYNQNVNFGDADNENDDVDYTPASCLPDAERFRDVEKFRFHCLACNVESNFPGVFHEAKTPEGKQLIDGLICVNPDCTARFWGHGDEFECFARLCNTMALWVFKLQKKYYEGVIRCDEPMCGLETRQLSVQGGVCLRRGCNGRMHSICTERAVYTQLKYLETLFDINHASEQNKSYGKPKDVLKLVSADGKKIFPQLHQRSKTYLSSSAFNWISSSFWQFATVQAQQ